MLTLKHLEVAIGHRVLLPDVNAQWHKGSLVALLGPNGSGKTTLLNHVAGIALRTPDRVFLQGEDIFAMPVRKRAARIASIAQRDEAELETRVCDRIAHGLFPRGTNDEECAVAKAARRLGIQDLLHRPLFSLSGGQRKKVHIARALVNESADVFILDEPDASLDATSRTALMQLLKDIAKSGKLVIISIHHRELADTYADQLLDLSQS